MKTYGFKLLVGVLLVGLMWANIGATKAVAVSLTPTAISLTTGQPHAGNFPAWRSYPTAATVTALAIEGNVIWVGTDGSGVLKLDITTGNTLATYTTSNSALVSNQVSAIAVDGAGNKWFGTTGGVSKFNNSNFTSYTKANSGLAENYILSIAVDRSGIVWFGTPHFGVISFDGRIWHTYTTANSGIAYNQVNSIVVDGANVKWFGLAQSASSDDAYHGALSKFDGSNWSNYATDDEVQGLAIDKAGNKWISLDGFYPGEAIGGADTVAKFDGSHFTFYTFPGIYNIAPAIAFDNAGIGWFTINNGAYKFDGTNWTAYYEPNGSYNTTGTAIPFPSTPIAIDANGNKWLGFNDRVSVLNDSRALLQVNPTALSFVGTAGTNPASQPLKLSAYNLDINWNASVSYGAGATNWLNLAATSGLLRQSIPLTLTTSVNTANVAPGVYTATINFQDSADAGDSASTNVTLSIASDPAKVYTYILTNQSENNYQALQNGSNRAANVQVQYFDLSGNLLINPAGTCSIVNPHAECINPVFKYSPPYYYEYYDPYAASYTTIVTSDQPLNSLTAGNSAFASRASDQLIVPLALNGAFQNYYTSFAVFNEGGSATTATVTFYDSNGNPQPAATRNLTLAAHSSTTLNQTNNFYGPGNNLPPNFYGWAQISGAAGSQLTAQVYETNFYIAFAAIFNAQPAQSVFSQTTLYAPAIFNGAFGGFKTGAALLNPNPNPVSVTITYYDSNGNAIPTAPFSIAAHSQATIYQGSTTGSNGLPAGGLPANFYGSAIITSQGGGISLLVNENGPSRYDNGSYIASSSQSGAYVAGTVGSSNVSLPAIANNGFGYTTGLTVLNTSNQTVNASLQYYNLDGTLQGQVQSFQLAPNASQPFYQGAAGLPSGFYGTALITQSGGPANSLLVTTNATAAKGFYSYIEPN